MALYDRNDFRAKSKLSVVPFLTIQPAQGYVSAQRGGGYVTHSGISSDNQFELSCGFQFRMHTESGLKKEEMKGFWSSVFRVIKETAPDLRLDLRAKDLPDAIIQSARDVGVSFRITTKCWMEQMGMPFHPTHINRKWDFMYLIEVMDNNGNGKIYPDLNKETPYIVVKLIR